MKCRVKQGFIDKETGKGLCVGDVYQCTEARFKEIQSKGEYLSVIAEKDPEIEKQKPKKAK